MKAKLIVDMFLSKKKIRTPHKLIVFMTVIRSEVKHIYFFGIFWMEVCGFGIKYEYRIIKILPIIII